VKYMDSFSSAIDKSVTLWQFRNGWDNLAVNPGADTTDPGMGPYGVFAVEGRADDGIVQFQTSTANFSMSPILPPGS